MNKINPFNRWEVTTGDFKFMQDPSTDTDPLIRDETLSRLADMIATPGIVIPKLALSSEIQNRFGNLTDASRRQFILSAGPTLGYISIGPGIAYNGKGEMVVVPVGDATVFNANAPTFTTTGVSGATPFSTGCIDVPANGVIGDATNRYVFISHLSVVRTKSLPSNHGTLGAGPVIPSTAYNSPVTSIDQEEGIAYAHHRLNGYKITVLVQGDITLDLLSDPEGTPIWTTDPTAIFIGRFISNIAGPDFTDAYTSPPRKVLQLKPHVVGTAAVAQRPPVYADGQIVTVQEHIAGIGTGSVTPRNPHGTAIADLEGSLEPGLANLQRDLARGIYNPAVSLNTPPLNNPLPGATAGALAPSISGALTLSGSVSWAEANGAITTYPNGTLFDKAVLLEQLKTMSINGVDMSQAVYVNGNRCIAAIPVSTNPLYAFIGFGAVNPKMVGSGTFTIFVMANPSNISQLLLGAAHLVEDGGAETLRRDMLPVCKVYWNATAATLHKSFVNQADTANAVDVRSTGFINGEDISTEAMTDVDKGIFSTQGFSTRMNLISNGDFPDNMRYYATFSNGNLNMAYNADHCYWANGWYYRKSVFAERPPLTGFGNALIGNATVQFLQPYDPLIYNPGGWAVTYWPTADFRTAAPTPHRIKDDDLLAIGKESAIRLNFTAAFGGVDFRMMTGPDQWNGDQSTGVYTGDIASFDGLIPLKRNRKYTVSGYLKIDPANRLIVSTRFVNAMGVALGTPPATVYSDTKEISIKRDSTYRRFSVVLTTDGTPPVTADGGPSGIGGAFPGLEIKFSNTGMSAGQYSPISVTGLSVVEGVWLTGPVQERTILLHPTPRYALGGMDGYMKHANNYYVKPDEGHAVTPTSSWLFYTWIRSSGQWADITWNGCYWTNAHTQCWFTLFHWPVRYSNNFITVSAFHQNSNMGTGPYSAPCTIPLNGRVYLPPGDNLIAINCQMNAGATTLWANSHLVIKLNP